MPLTRTESWDHRELHDFFLARRAMPFAWGANDCCLFPADAILAMTGVDIAADFRGQYTDEASAMKAIRRIAKGSTVEDAAAYCAAQHGLQEWLHNGLPAPLLAKRGDLVVLEDAGRLIAGVVHLRGTHVAAVSQDGMMLKSIRCIKRAWRV